MLAEWLTHHGLGPRKNDGHDTRVGDRDDTVVIDEPFYAYYLKA